ncbi:MAG: hypothetical protein P1U63_01735 [Coxiellaceae bacterium]|nr:hypothetical protein [Coxiellaceae bacterium]
MRFFIILLGSLLALGMSGEMYAVGDCQLDSEVCTFTIDLSCPTASGTYRSGDVSGDWVFYTRSSKPVKFNGAYNHIDFYYYPYSSNNIDYSCVEDNGNDSDYSFVYSGDINLLDRVRAFLSKNTSASISCYFINSDPSNGARCVAINYDSNTLQT